MTPNEKFELISQAFRQNKALGVIRELDDVDRQKAALALMDLGNTNDSMNWCEWNDHLGAATLLYVITCHRLPGVYSPLHRFYLGQDGAFDGFSNSRLARLVHHAAYASLGYQRSKAANWALGRRVLGLSNCTQKRKEDFICNKEGIYFAGPLGEGDLDRAIRYFIGVALPKHVASYLEETPPGKLFTVLARKLKNAPATVLASRLGAHIEVKPLGSDGFFIGVRRNRSTEVMMGLGVLLKSSFAFGCSNSCVELGLEGLDVLGFEGKGGGWQSSVWEDRDLYGFQ